MSKKGKILKTVISIAGEISPDLEKAVKTCEEKMDDLHTKAVKFGAAAAAAVAAASAASAKAVSYLTDLGGAYDSATNGIAASTGLAGDQLAGLEETMESLYGRQYGETLDATADGVTEVYRMLKLTGDELENTAAGAFALEETFDYAIPESTRAAKAIMDNFGESGEYAMGLIAAGAQNGLDYSGELLDSVSEYSVQFAKLGFSADEMFAIFQRGADSGAWNLDKVGDAVKEFSIRSIDGSKATIEAYKTLGFSADEAMSIFAAGGEEAEYAFQVVLKELIAMDDQVKRDAVGVALFGTMWEDLGVEAVASMIDVQSTAYDAEDALGKINAVKYDSLDAAMEGIKRSAELQLLPAADTVTDAFIGITPEIQEMVNTAIPYMTDFAESIVPVITNTVTLANGGLQWLAENGEKLLPIVAGLTAAYLTYKGISAAMTVVETAKYAAIAAGIPITSASAVATWALNSAVAFLTSPIVIATAAIAALVAAGVWLYQNWDIVKEKAAQLGEFLGGVWQAISTAVSGFLSGVTEGFVTAFSSLAGIVKGPINAVIGIVNGAINAINSIGFTIPDWVPIIGGKAFSVNIPNLPMLATGGHTDGVSIAGEDGMETVISYDPAYREQNLGYLADAARMLGASDYLLGESGGSCSFDITFAPQITVQGNADRGTIMDAIEDEYPEFCDMLEDFLIKKGLIAYA